MTGISKLQKPTGPLAGIRVVDLTINVLGPVATQILGDMGADVIKVEAPEGDYMRHLGLSRTEGMGVFFLNINRNKRSMVLDLKQAAAREKLGQLSRPPTCSCIPCVPAPRKGWASAFATWRGEIRG